jgi:hypothetical protein
VRWPKDSTLASSARRTRVRRRVRVRSGDTAEWHARQQTGKDGRPSGERARSKATTPASERHGSMAGDTGVSVCAPARCEQAGKNRVPRRVIPPHGAKARLHSREMGAVLT